MVAFLRATLGFEQDIMREGAHASLTKHPGQPANEFLLPSIGAISRR